MTAEQAQAERDKGNFVREEEGGFRRIVASPAPIEIYEIDAIRALADAGPVSYTHLFATMMHSAFGACFAT